jgi:hypothetical protein
MGSHFSSVVVSLEELVYVVAVSVVVSVFSCSELRTHESFSPLVSSSHPRVETHVRESSFEHFDSVSPYTSFSTSGFGPGPSPDEYEVEPEA